MKAGFFEDGISRSKIPLRSPFTWPTPHEHHGGRGESTDFLWGLGLD